MTGKARAEAQRRRGLDEQEINRISGVIVDAAITVHKALGPGLLESIYQKILPYELSKRGVSCATEVPLAISYDGLLFEHGYRLDLLAEDLVIVELKSLACIDPVHKKQLLTYLRLADKPLGLLLNFNVEIMKHGIVRLVNNL